MDEEDEDEASLPKLHCETSDCLGDDDGLEEGNVVNDDGRPGVNGVS